jgi:glutamate racemase
MAPSSPIVVLDSGLGGLTVVRALRAALPREHILYFGDTARLPYGNKTATTVTNFVHQIINFLRPHGPKHIVIACNTATALALPAIRCGFPEFQITGVIEPGARAAVEAAGAKHVPIIGVIATEATVRSLAYERAIRRRRQLARLIQQPTPLLVPIIEEGRSGADPLVRLALKQYLDPLLRYSIDVLVLGCTHYPILKETISQIVGSQVKVIDSADQCAQDVARRLAARGLARPAEPFVSTGSLHAFVTDDPGRFKRLAKRFLDFDIDLPTWVSPNDLYRQNSTAMVPVSIPA